jgi:Zn-dependent protease
VLLQYIAIFLALLIVLPVHEYAHALAADKCGDNTPRVNGRLTLNPMAHFDVYGLVAMVLVHFGWGKPVPVNPYNFKNRRLGCFLVSIAGVLANYLLAFITIPILYLLEPCFVLFDFGYFDEVIIFTLYYIPALCLSFVAFNLLPIFPLDGFKLFETLTTKKGKVYRFLCDYGQYIIFGLIALGFVADRIGLPQLDVLSIYVRWFSNILGRPIYAFWGLVF